MQGGDGQSQGILILKIGEQDPGTLDEQELRRRDSAARSADDEDSLTAVSHLLRPWFLAVWLESCSFEACSVSRK